ncbi:DUF1120 domain-containing protein [Pseudomonas sp. NPDC087612]|uniref:DUF1120 domain-containing protein n=1 Tax=Pseudomonas sp. NPDC087612 TaxID=3364441 RepID=UPI0038118B01
MKNMTKHLSIALGLTALAAVSVPAHASSVDLKVIGSITPASCVPTLGGGGTVDYGTIHPSTLSDTTPTLLQEREIPFTVTCSAPAKFGLTAIEGRPNTALGTLWPSGVAEKPASVTFNSGTWYAAGLGLADGKKIGGYSLVVKTDTVMADGAAIATIHRNADWAEGTFAASTTASGMYSGGIRTVSWATPATTVPVAITNLNGSLAVQAYLNTTTELDMSKPIALDGLTTLELVYL